MCREFGFTKGVKDHVKVNFHKAALAVASADGELAASEKNFILSRAAACGIGSAEMKELDNFTYTNVDDLKSLVKDMEKTVGNTLIYVAAGAAYADENIDIREREALDAVAEALEVSKHQVNSIVSLVKAEAAFRAHRLAVLYPEGNKHQ